MSRSVFKFSNLCVVLLFINFSFGTAFASCGKFEWRCDDGECIAAEDVCDGTKNCADGSDETVEQCIGNTCPPISFRCAYGACIPFNRMCDEKVDCADGSDELDILCSTDVEDGIYGDVQGNCTTSELMQCKSRKCITIYNVCDGKIDCSDDGSDDSDENLQICGAQNCPPYNFRCGYGACIPIHKKCDGKPDCTDNSDEGKELCRPANKICRVTSVDENLEIKRVDNGLILSTGAEVKHGTEVKFKCEKNWKLIGSKRSMCEHIGWTNPIPYCSFYCRENITRTGISTEINYCVLNDRNVNCFENVLTGTAVKFTCAKGYVHKGKTSTEFKGLRRCNSNGKWNASRPKCFPQCGLKSPCSKNSPWDVTIYRLDSLTFRKQCVGTIVSPKLVISAKSCFTKNSNTANNDHELYNIVAGIYEKPYDDPKTINSDVFNVSEIHTESTLYKSNQIAILVLVNYFNFSSTLVPACLQLKHFTTAPYHFQSRQFLNITEISKPEERIGGGTFQVRRFNNEIVYYLTSVFVPQPVHIASMDTTLKTYLDRYEFLL